jgi:uncharacterized protein YjbJ (UPF0337 family)
MSHAGERESAPDGIPRAYPSHGKYGKENPMGQQEVGGKVKKTKGKMKEAVGILSGNKKMEREGSFQRAEGAVQEGLGQARRKVGEVLTNLGKAVNKK